MFIRKELSLIFEEKVLKFYILGKAPYNVIISNDSDSCTGVTVIASVSFGIIAIGQVD